MQTLHGCLDLLQGVQRGDHSAVRFPQCGCPLSQNLQGFSVYKLGWRVLHLGTAVGLLHNYGMAF